MYEFISNRIWEGGAFFKSQVCLQLVMSGLRGICHIRVPLFNQSLRITLCYTDIENVPPYALFAITFTENCYADSKSNFKLDAAFFRQ